MERIKIARQKKGISQKALADSLGVTQQAVSYYENGSRLPDDEVLSAISDILNVPPQYLTEETNDPEGWDLWEEATGYSPEQIKKEIQRMKAAKHIVGNDNDLQNLIKQAVNNLGGNGNTDRGIISSIYYGIMDLQHDLQRKYEDPDKLAKLQGIGSMKIRSGVINDSDLIYDDLSVDAYHRAMDILIQARRDLDKISNDLRLN